MKQFIFFVFLCLILGTTGCGRDKPVRPMKPAKPEKSAKPDFRTRVHQAEFNCDINEEGFCIFDGSPHDIDLGIENGIIVDARGNRVFSQGKPFQDGYTLIPTEEVIINDSESGYIRVFRTMAPVRDALMYDIAALSSATWDNLTIELRTLGIKTESKNLDSDNPRDMVYGIDDIYTLAKNPAGQIIHHPVMRFLEEAELEIKCLWTQTNLTNPEGIDPCTELRTQ